MINEKYELNEGAIHNRVVFQPMEGCDCREDGSPGALTRRKYLRFAAGKAGIIWFEASAVCEEGRTNPRQMMLTEGNLDEFKRLTEDVKNEAFKASGFEPKLFVQLTHSGRQSMRPVIAYHNPVYERDRPLDDSHVATDEYFDSLPEKFSRSAALAQKAGFDGVDVKCCHGYLMQELLSAYGRKGRYGGSFDNRTRLFTDCIKAVVSAVDILTVSRLGVCDMVARPYGFGNDENGEIDFSEPKMLLGRMISLGIKMLNVTIGNPYYNPHVNRPYRKGFYAPPETPEKGLERFISVEKELKKAYPQLPIVGSGMSYYRGGMMNKAEELLSEGVCDFAGFGRQTLAYPEFYSDWLEGILDERKCCVTCSKCTVLMRNKCTAGCAVFDDVYKALYKEKISCQR